MSKDWTGQKFGRLTFVKQSDRKTGTSIIWELICDCGNTTHVVPSRVANGKTSSCGCYRKESSSARLAAKRQFDPKYTSARRAWQGRYKDCDFNVFLELSQLACHYCGSPPNNKYNYIRKESSKYQIDNGTFIYNGIDRIDSQKGHVKGNIVPCCWTCNWMKRDLSLEEFKEQIRKINFHLL